MKVLVSGIIGAIIGVLVYWLLHGKVMPFEWTNPVKFKIMGGYLKSKMGTWEVANGQSVATDQTIKTMGSGALLHR